MGKMGIVVGEVWGGKRTRREGRGLVEEGWDGMRDGVRGNVLLGGGSVGLLTGQICAGRGWLGNASAVSISPEYASGFGNGVRDTSCCCPRHSTAASMGR